MNRRDFLSTTSLAAAGVLAARAGVIRAASSSGPVVETASGKIRGYMDRNVYAFRGVPYGDTTAGANRFLPPRKPQSWTGVREAIELGHRAPQLDAPRVPEWFVMDRTEPQGEDCLVVNIWTPALDSQKRPVVVWLHGGGFTAGATASPRTTVRISRAGTTSSSSG